MRVADELIERAIGWAMNALNSTDYTFKCLAFVEDAYERANDIEMFGGSTATESATMYGCITDSAPVRGSFVFYRTSGPVDGVMYDWGHVGLCIGDGMVIHAWDRVRIDDYLEIRNLKGAPGWSVPEYIGWTSPEIFLKDSVPKKY